MDAKKNFRGIRFSADVIPFVARMTAVDVYRENLLRLQGVWDSLAMMGKMSGSLPDIGATRSAFDALTGTLLDRLAQRLLANALDELASRSQVAVDILVRNLFERTADIGFLATDLALREQLDRFHASGAMPGREALQARFREYVAKYSVYDDIVVLSTGGDVLARLDEGVACTRSREAWIAEAASRAGYLERYGALDLFDGRRVLVYASAIRNASGVAGVLCLSFRLDDEAERIFGQLAGASEAGGRPSHGVVALLDGERRVVVSSDRWQLPMGAVVQPASAGGARWCFAGRDYLGVESQPTPYEGYRGPGWTALALMPVDAAFDDTARQHADDAVPGTAGELSRRLDLRQLFDAELMSIGPQAQRIGLDLARLLWNGKLACSTAAGNDFAPALLGEVGRTGERIRAVFDEATGDLYRSTLQAVFDQAEHHARLAIDIVDRNLYERANDCRWWALDGVLRDTLAEGGAPAAQSATEVLKTIHGLYTVYALLLMFDAQGRVFAVSQPAASGWVGRTLDEPWVRETLALRDSQSHAVSRHQRSALYGDRETFVYAAALRAPGDDAGAPVGGIAIVFDGRPQFAAMLRDALPRGVQGAAGLLVSRGGQVLASTDERWPVGAAAPQPGPWGKLARGESGTAVIDLDGVAHAVGYAVAGGYREYPVARCEAADDAVALVLVRLGEPLPTTASEPAAFEAAAGGSARQDGAAPLRVASFRVGNEWLGVKVGEVVESLGAVRPTALPNAPRTVLGMLQHQGRMLPAIDLGLARGAALPTADDAPWVVVRDEADRRLALRVDALGDVFDVPVSSVQRVRFGFVADGQGRDESLICGRGAALALLDLGPLWCDLGSVSAANRAGSLPAATPRVASAASAAVPLGSMTVGA